MRAEDPHKVFARIVEETQWLLQNYRNFRFIPPSIIAGSILDYSEREGVVKCLEDYQANLKELASVQRHLQLTILETISEALPQSIKVGDLQSAVITRLQESGVIDENKNVSKDFGVALFRLSDSGLIINLNERRRGVRGEYISSQKRELEEVTTFITTVNNEIMQSKQYKSQYPLEQQRFTRDQERRIIHYLHTLTPGSDAWNKLSWYTVQHYYAFISKLASSPEFQHIDKQELIHQGYLSLLETLAVFEWRGFGLLSLGNSRIISGMRNLKKGEGNQSLESPIGDTELTLVDTIAAPEQPAVISLDKETEERMEKIRARMEPILEDTSHEDNPYYLVDVLFWNLGLGGKSLDAKEISGILQVSVSTVYKYIRLATKKLQQDPDFLIFLLKIQTGTKNNE
jgi:hypothetical protein